MKLTNILAVILFLALNVNAQTYQPKYYLNANKKPTSEAQAKFVRIKKAQAAVTLPGYSRLMEYQVRDYYYPSMKLEFESLFWYSPDNYSFGVSDCFHGPATWYYETGQIKMKGTYDACKPDGFFISYDRNGKVTKEVRYIQGEIMKTKPYEDFVYQPLIGKWACYKQLPNGQYEQNKRFCRTFENQGIATGYHDYNNPIWGWAGMDVKEKPINYKYIKISNKKGIVEYYTKDILTTRYIVEWIDYNNLKLTMDHSKNSNPLGYFPSIKYYCVRMY